MANLEIQKFYGAITDKKTLTLPVNNQCSDNNAR